MNTARGCHVCSEPIADGAGVPCTYCEGWFHLPLNTSTPGAVCGRRTLNYTAEGVCGVLYICAPCEQRLAGAYATRRPSIPGPFPPILGERGDLRSWDLRFWPRG